MYQLKIYIFYLNKLPVSGCTATTVTSSSSLSRPLKIKFIILIKTIINARPVCFFIVIKNAEIVSLSH